MAKFPTYEEMSKKVAEKALDEFLYNGKSIREWMQIIASEDAVSRKAVLDIVDSYSDSQSNVEDVTQDIISDIMALPPAQPEIVRCCQCKYAEVADKEDAQDGYTCQFHRGSIWFGGSYCSWAERRQDG